MKVGVIGAGRIGSLHIRNIVKDRRVTEVVVTDVNAMAAREIAEEVSAQTVGSVSELWNSSLDAVLVCSSTSTHPDLILEAARRGIPIFCEKPIALDPRAALPVLKVAKSFEPRVHIGFPRRFDPGFVSARDDLYAGRLGDVSLVRVTTLDPEPPPAAYVAGSGGMFRDQTIHDFDTLRWLLRDEVRAVSAIGGDRTVDYIRAAGDTDTAVTTVEFESGTLAVVTNSRVNGAGYDIRLELHGTKNAVAAGLADFTPISSSEQGATFPQGPAARFFTDRFSHAYRAELEEFISFARGERESPCTIEDALCAGWVAEATDLSWREGRVVEISEVSPELP